MFRATRIAIAAILGVAIAALPVVLDRCAESCEAHQHTGASTPACHHAAPTGTHISQVPAPCGHDHHGTAVMAAKGPASTGRGFASTVTAGCQPTLAPPVAAALRLRPH